MSDNFSRQIGLKVERRVRAQRTPSSSVWLGLGVTGIIGWSIAVPALLGVLLGYWLDRRYPGAHSWTLALLVAGLCLGCFHAWMWVVREGKAMVESEALTPTEPQNEEQDVKNA